MPRCLGLNKISADPWIKHFQYQAVNGGSNRANNNKRYILVTSSTNKNNSDQIDKNNSKQEANNKLPAIVSPIQQSVEQAEEQVRREAENFTLDDSVNVKSNKLVSVNKVANKVAKRQCGPGNKKGKRRKKIVKDIFSG